MLLGFFSFYIQATVFTCYLLTLLSVGIISVFSASLCHWCRILNMLLQCSFDGFWFAWSWVTLSTHWHNAFPRPLPPNLTITAKRLTQNINVSLPLTLKQPFEVARTGQWCPQNVLTVKVSEKKYLSTHPWKDMYTRLHIHTLWCKL